MTEIVTFVNTGVNMIAVTDHTVSSLIRFPSTIRQSALTSSTSPFSSSLVRNPNPNLSPLSSYTIMSSCNVEFPVIGAENNPDESDAGEDSGSAAFYSQTTDVLPYSTAAGESCSDPNKSDQITPNGRLNPYYYKKLKLDAVAVAADSSGGGDYRVDYRKDREEWNDSAISCLLDAYIEKFTQLNRGNLRGRDWEQVAQSVTEGCDKKLCKSVEQCKNKIDNLKKRYKVELQRMNSGGLSVSHWHWFKKMEVIVGNLASMKSVSDDDRSNGGGNSSYMLRQSKRLATNNANFVNSTKLKSTPRPKWRRVVFKISGVALSGNCQSIDSKVALEIAKEVTTVCHLGVQVAIVVGGRNFFCGDSWVSATDLDRPTAYQIGMMATVMNSVLLQSALEKLGVQTRVQSAFSMPEVAEPYNRLRAIRHLEKGRVVIFGGVGAGTGNPLFTTDTAAALRASEISADAILKGTNVNGVYDCQNNNVTLDHVSYREVVSRGVTSMDMMAIQFCEENAIPVVVFNLLEPGNISRALSGEQIGTLIDQTGKIS